MIIILRNIKEPQFSNSNLSPVKKIMSNIIETAMLKEKYKSETFCIPGTHTHVRFLTNAILL